MNLLAAGDIANYIQNTPFQSGNGDSGATPNKNGFNWSGLASGVGGLISGGVFGNLFGGGDNGAGAARTQQNAALLGEQAVTQHWNDLANSNLGSFNRYGLQSDAAIGSLADYLRRDPYTSQRDSQDLAQITNRLSPAFDQAIANSRVANAGNGLDTVDSSGQSSVGAGANAYQQAMRANAMGSAQNDLAYKKIAARQGQMNDLVSLLTGQRDAAYNKGSGALGSASSGYSDLATKYGDLAKYLDELNASRSKSIGDFVSAIPSIATKVAALG